MALIVAFPCARPWRPLLSTVFAGISRAAVAEIDAGFFGSQHHPPRATTNTTLQHHRHNPTKLLASVSTFAFLAEAAGEVGAGFHYTTTPQSQKPIVLCKYAGRKCRKSRETIAIECTNFKLCRGRQICAHSAKDGWTIELVSTFARQPTILKSPEFGVRSSVCQQCLEFLACNSVGERWKVCVINECQTLAINWNTSLKCRKATEFGNFSRGGNSEIFQLICLIKFEIFFRNPTFYVEFKWLITVLSS